MKRSIVTTVLMVIFFGLKAIASHPDDCYLKAGGQVYFGKDIKMGPIHTRIILPDGTVAKVANKDITAYRHHNRQYMLLPVICDNNDTLCKAMMEFITAKSGYSIYKYCCPKNTNAFFVYKDGKFYQRIDEDQADILKSFGIKVI
jgi:hypothetical protein